MIKTKQILKVVFYFFAGIALIYVCFAVYFGGFGAKKRENIFVYNQNSIAIIAHRGISNYYPEHSVASTEKAIELGFKAIEIDLRKTRDDVYVLLHDADLERLVGKKVSLDSVDFESIRMDQLIFNSVKTSNHLLAFRKFLELYKDSFVIYVDMKEVSFKDADEVVKIIQEHKAEKKCMLASASASFVFYVESNYPNIYTALEGFDSGKEWMYSFIPKDLEPDYFSGFLDKTNSKQVDWLKKKNLLDYRIVYGVDKKNYQEAKKMGLKNIMLDFDSTMLEDLRNDGLKP